MFFLGISGSHIGYHSSATAVDWHFLYRERNMFFARIATQAPLPSLEWPVAGAAERLPKRQSDERALCAALEKVALAAHDGIALSSCSSLMTCLIFFFIFFL
jgi:hypothetical protein